MGECDLIATVQPEDASNKSLLWASTNEDVASVDNMGHVSLLKEGTATIIVSSTDGSNLSAKCEVMVLPPTGIEDIKANPEAYVRVYNMSGVLMYEGLYSRMNLNAGYYVIQYNGSSFVHRIK